MAEVARRNFQKTRRPPKSATKRAHSLGRDKTLGLKANMVEFFDEAEFEAKVGRAMERVKTIVDNTRNPMYPSDVPHQVRDM